MVQCGSMVNAELLKYHPENEPTLLELNRRQALYRLEQGLQTPKEMLLREHQISMIQAVHDFLQRGETAGYMSEPTGVGKAAVAVKLAEIMGLRTIILSPTQQILLQTNKDTSRFAPNLNLTNYYAREKNLSGKVINTTYQSIPTLVESGTFNSNDTQLVICDEVHTALGKQRHTIFRNFPNALKIGLTATPYFDQLEGYKSRGIVSREEEWAKLFTNLIHEMALEEAMEREILSSLDVHLLKTNTVVSDIQILSGEYKESDLRKYFATKARNTLAIGVLAGADNIPKEYQISKEQKDEIENIHNKIAGKRTAIFAVDIEHAEELAQELRNKGISAAAVHSKVDILKREQILKAHLKGEVQVVTGVDMLSIGWDSPATEVGIYLRPTYSAVVAVQQLGRVLRPSPETGKQKAIAIQLVDQFIKRVNSPVLIPDIFDPEYVLRGSQTGERSTGTKPITSRERTIVSFSGMNIESIIEEARSRELLKTRFTRGSLEDAVNLFRKLAEDAREENPDIGTYELSRIIVDQLPQRIPFEAQQKALQAFASIDTNTKRLGHEAFLLLNLKTVLSVVDSFFTEELDRKEDREEMMHSAIASVLEKSSTIKPNIVISIQVHRFAEAGIMEYLAKRDNMPISWLRVRENRSTIATRIKEAFGKSNRILTNEEINNIARDLSEKTGINKNNLRHYINYINSLRVQEDKTYEDQTFKEATKEATNYGLREDLDEVLQTITSREASVLTLRFGLEDGRERTLSEVAAELGVTKERIRQIEAKALRRLRHPTRARKLRLYDLGEDVTRPISAIHPVSSSTIEMTLETPPDPEDLFPYSIETLNLPDAIKHEACSSGIRNIGDFFSASPREIGDEWSGSTKNLLSALIAVTQKTYKLYEVSIEDYSKSQMKLFNHILESVLYRDKNFTLKGLEEYKKKQIFNKAYKNLRDYRNFLL